MLVVKQGLSLFMLGVVLYGCKLLQQSQDSLGLLAAAGLSDTFGGYQVSATAQPTLVAWGQQGLCIEGRDFDVIISDRQADLSVLAIHGGIISGDAIEPGTSAIAARMASELQANLYDFQAHAHADCLGSDPRPVDRRHMNILHITATNFDEPRALALVGAHNRAIAIHGFEYRPGKPTDLDVICVGGAKNDVLVDRFIAAMNAQSNAARAEGFQLTPVDARSGHDTNGYCSGLGGESLANIVNRNARHSGLQLEMSRRIRDALADPQQAASRVRLWGALMAAVRATLAPQ